MTWLFFFCCSEFFFFKYTYLRKITSHPIVPTHPRWGIPREILNELGGPQSWHMCVATLDIKVLGEAGKFLAAHCVKIVLKSWRISIVRHPLLNCHVVTEDLAVTASVCHGKTRTSHPSGAHLLAQLWWTVWGTFTLQETSNAMIKFLR